MYKTKCWIWPLFCIVPKKGYAYSTCTCALVFTLCAMLATRIAAIDTFAHYMACVVAF